MAKATSESTKKGAGPRSDPAIPVRLLLLVIGQILEWLHPQSEPVQAHKSRCRRANRALRWRASHAYFPKLDVDGGKLIWGLVMTRKLNGKRQYRTMTEDEKAQYELELYYGW